MILGFFFVLSVYVLVIGMFLYGFTKMEKQSIVKHEPKTKFSIVVPFRNEADNLPKLLHCFSLLNYPKEMFEVILVDDDSEEVFSFQSSVFSLKIIKNQRKSNAPKKDAINTAITIAKYDWIITTDADCFMKENWLQSIDNHIQKTDCLMVASPVMMLPNNSFLHQFQHLDFLSLQGTTIGSFGVRKPFMCNGANFAYKKSFFHELNGFDGNQNIASGDDVFLLQKAIQKQKEKVSFCFDYDSVVGTLCVISWKALFFQRVRWASKTSAYKDGFSKMVAVVVFLTNLLLVICFGLCLIGTITYENLLLFFGIKFIIDFLILTKTARFFKTRMQYILISSLWYPFFTVGVAFYALFGKYQWKDRTF